MKKSLEKIEEVPQPWQASGRAAAHGAAAPRAEVVSYGEDRRGRGERVLAEITGESGMQVIDQLREIAPDFADWVVEFSYGEVMSRPGLDRRTRQLATVAALTALGNAQPQLRTHIEGSLRVGCRPQEIIEVILQMAVYAGFPAAINGLTLAREVFEAVPGERSGDWKPGA